MVYSVLRDYAAKIFKVGSKHKLALVVFSDDLGIYFSFRLPNTYTVLQAEIYANSLVNNF